MVLYKYLIIKVLLPTPEVCAGETQIHVKIHGQRSLALTLLQGIHGCLAHGFILIAVLDLRALINSCRFNAGVALQGSGYKENKHETGLSVDHQVLPMLIQKPLKKITLQNIHTLPRNGLVKYEDHSPKYSYITQEWVGKMYLFQGE